MPDEPTDHYETVTRMCPMSHCCHKPIFYRHRYIPDGRGGVVRSGKVNTHGVDVPVVDKTPIPYCSGCGQACQTGETIPMSVPEPRPRGKRSGPSTDIDDYLAHQPQEEPHAEG